MPVLDLHVTGHLLLYSNVHAHRVSSQAMNPRGDFVPNRSLSENNTMETVDRIKGTYGCSRKGAQNMRQKGIEKRMQMHKEEPVLVTKNAERGER